MLITRKWDKWKLILLFFCPAVLIWMTTMLIPFLYGIFISFTKWDGIADNYTIIGLANYEKVFNTSKFWLSLQRTGIYTVGTVVLSNVVALILGLLLTSSLKGRNAFRTAIYVPNVVGGVAMGYIWQYIFNYGFTKIGQQLGSAYFSTSMLSDPNKAMIALVDDIIRLSRLDEQGEGAHEDHLTGHGDAGVEGLGVERLPLLVEARLGSRCLDGLHAVHARHRGTLQVALGSLHATCLALLVIHAQPYGEGDGEQGGYLDEAQFPVIHEEQIGEDDDIEHQHQCGRHIEQLDAGGADAHEAGDEVA